MQGFCAVIFAPYRGRVLRCQPSGGSASRLTTGYARLAPIGAAGLASLARTTPLMASSDVYGERACAGSVQARPLAGVLVQWSAGSAIRKP